MFSQNAALMLPSVAEISFRFRAFFYLVMPNETFYATPEEVPKYFELNVPYFFIMIVAESLILLYIDGKAPRVEDQLTNVAAALLMRFLNSFVYMSVDLFAYNYVWHNWRFVALPWDSPWTWLLALVLVDLGYYWNHRCSHEISIMWAFHQVHHGSEEYNLATAIRNSTLQKLFSWIFYLPMSFFIPPAIFLAHVQLNLLYQFPIHTRLIKTLGPLEYVLNTPSHHRVHHGRNKYCLDKNYGGVLIIFDRIFGTFEPEREKEPVVFGLLHPLTSMNIYTLSVFHLEYILRSAWKVEGVGNKFKAFLYGPGWSVGKPRLGDPADLPDVKHPQPRYCTGVQTWYHFYACAHLAPLGALVMNIQPVFQVLPAALYYLVIVYFLWTLMSITINYDSNYYGPFTELTRCVFTVAVLYSWKAVFVLYSAQIWTYFLLFYLLSSLIWVPITLLSYSNPNPRRLAHTKDYYYYTRD